MCFFFCLFVLRGCLWLKVCGTFCFACIKVDLQWDLLWGEKVSLSPLMCSCADHWIFWGEIQCQSTTKDDKILVHSTQQPRRSGVGAWGRSESKHEEERRERNKRKEHTHRRKGWTPILLSHLILLVFGRTKPKPGWKVFLWRLVNLRRKKKWKKWHSCRQPLEASCLLLRCGEHSCLTGTITASV